jgi:hypothetical protein
MSSYGASFTNHNTYPSDDIQGRSLIANNEIIVYARNSFMLGNIGIQVENAKADLVHNSIYVSGDGLARGIYLANSSSLNDMVIKNNNIVLTPSLAHPIYFNNPGNLQLYDIDYNNLYAPLSIGYYDGNITTMEAWQQTITTDLHSVRVLPDYPDPLNHLKFTTKGGKFLCDKIPSVTVDIDKEPRLNNTMGSYEIPLQTTNAILSELIGMREGSVLLEKDTIKVVVLNGGLGSLNSVKLDWSINGTSQTTGGVNYPVSLTTGQSDTITLGEITYSSTGSMNITVWITQINNSGIDNDSSDDTLSKTTIICSNGYSGLLTVGSSPNNDFQTIEQMYDAFNLCGLNGDITVSFEPGIYTGSMDFSNNTHAITITSTTNKMNDVIIRPFAGSGIKLDNSRNLVIRNITVDAATSGTNAIEFTGPCTNIVIRDCKLLANPTTTSTTINPIYKGYNTGVLDSIFFIHNTLDGGYIGLYIYGGTGMGLGIYGTNIVFDSNTVTNSYFSGITPFYAILTSCSYNTILSRTTNTSSAWYGIYLNYSTATVIGNRIIQQSTAITSPWGIYNYYNNTDQYVQDRLLIANNEIILSCNLSSFANAAGIYVYFSKVAILHNSIYMSGTGAGKGISISNNNAAANNLLIKNNNIVLTPSAAYPIYFDGTVDIDLYDIDYNNLYAPTNIGYYSGNITTIGEWQQRILTDKHSVSMLPSYIDYTTSLELAKYSDTLLCPLADVYTDINNNPRTQITYTGAYIKPALGQDLSLLQFSPWNVEVINNQPVEMNIDLLNTGIVSINSATFGWSLNGQTQPVVSWTATTPLQSLEVQNIYLDTFRAINANTFNVSVWIESVNGEQDTVTGKNDTLWTTTVIHPLVEFTAPIEDTLYTLDFDVYAKIRTMTGAPVTPPMLYLKTIVGGVYFLDDSIPMIQNGELWQVSIPQRYYGSKVIYSLTVSDTVNNTLTAKDSVYIPPVTLRETDSVIIGNDNVSFSYAPISMDNNYSWSRQIYLYREICPDIFPLGTYITKIAWKSLTANAVYTNQICYMRTIDDSVEATGYWSPLANGASQVWTGTINIIPGWVEITLDTPFYLPANKNLEIIWENRHGSFNVTTHAWACTSTSNYMTVYTRGASFPASTASLSLSRPNIKITKETYFNLYPGNDLGLISFLSPVPDMDNLCAGADYEPVIIRLGNFGENDYDFSVNPIKIQYEITDPQQTKYVGSVQIRRGTLASKESKDIELIDVFPVMYAGKYELKAWVESLVDNIPYNDTITYTYISGRVGLPVDEMFNSDLLPDFFVKAVNTTAKWEVVQRGSGADTVVKPQQGSGMLAFTGNKGAMTHLFTRQLDLSGTILPTLTFWYFHDTIPSDDYMDVRITTNGGETYTLLKSLLKQDAAYGWQPYTTDLTTYMNGQCIQILFEAMRMSSGTGSQYIDRIFISSQPDLAISKIELPLQFACDLSNAELQIEISALTNQVIDLSQFSTSLAVEIPGYQTLSPIPLQKRMEGNSSDTISISVPNLPSGNYTIKVYLTTPVDNLSGNDTAYYIVDIQPALSVTVIPVTTINSRIKIGTEVWQEVVIENTGTVNISGIELILRITGTNQYIIRETLPVDLAAGETYTHPFVKPYIVPADERYQVYLTAYMTCDSAHVNAGNAIEEYVDLHNLSVISIDNPLFGQLDTVGATVNITVSLANTDDVNSFENVSIYAVIESEGGEELINRWGSVEEILPLDTQQFTFRESYTVPEDSIYRIRVYLGKVDNYQENDTAEMIRRTVKGNVSVKEIDRANVFTLGQNIPNPANNRTRIDYSIPEVGEVVFNLHSVSGQLLYSKTIEAASGKQSLELNTSTFAAGIYFYSIEYKGQRLVKRMMISGQVNE